MSTNSSSTQKLLETGIECVACYVSERRKVEATSAKVSYDVKSKKSILTFEDTVIGGFDSDVSKLKNKKLAIIHPEDFRFISDCKRHKSKVIGKIENKFGQYLIISVDRKDDKISLQSETTGSLFTFDYLLHGPIDCEAIDELEVIFCEAQKDGSVKFDTGVVDGTGHINPVVWGGWGLHEEKCNITFLPDSLEYVNNNNYLLAVLHSKTHFLPIQVNDDDNIAYYDDSSYPFSCGDAVKLLGFENYDDENPIFESASGDIVMARKIMIAVKKEDLRDTQRNWISIFHEKGQVEYKISQPGAIKQQRKKGMTVKCYPIDSHKNH